MSRGTPRRQKTARTTDGVDNFAARVGVSQDNLLAATRYTGKVTFTQPELDDMYRTSWVVGRMVDVVAEDMVRSGISMKSELAPDQIDQLGKSMVETGIPARIADTIKWSRLYGGALAVILIDGQDLNKPLDIETIPVGGFKGLHVLDRHQVTPSYQVIRELGSMLGYPESYQINAEAMQGDTVHHSRAIRFVGVELPYRERCREQSWGASVVERVFERILALDSSTYGAANLMLRSHVRTLGVKELRKVLATGGPALEGLVRMMRMVRQTQSNEGVFVHDAEDIPGAQSWSFAGVYDALQAFCEQIAGASGIPLVRLLGQSSKGFSTGESDLKTYYETISTAQGASLRGPYHLLLKILSRSLWGRPLPNNFNFDFNPLATLSETEKSQISTADSQAAAGLVAGGVIDRGQALKMLRETSRITGRFTSITDEDIAAAENEAAAPPLPEGLDLGFGA